MGRDGGSGVLAHVPAIDYMGSLPRAASLVKGIVAGLVNRDLA